MQRAQVSTLLLGLTLAWFASTPSMTAMTAIAATEVLAPNAFLAARQDFIRGKQPVPDDPLAGLPTEEGEGRKGHVGKSSCALKASAANDKNIGDLRATLAFVKLGPRSWPCPRHASQVELRLRIEIDGTGKVTAVEPVAGDSGMGRPLAKRLTGRAIGPRTEGSTSGIVVVTFSNSRQ